MWTVDLPPSHEGVALAGSIAAGVERRRVQTLRGITTAIRHRAGGAAATPEIIILRGIPAIVSNVAGEWFGYTEELSIRSLVQKPSQSKGQLTSIAFVVTTNRAEALLSSKDSKPKAWLLCNALGDEVRCPVRKARGSCPRRKRFRTASLTGTCQRKPKLQGETFSSCY